MVYDQGVEHPRLSFTRDVFMDAWAVQKRSR